MSDQDEPSPDEIKKGYDYYNKIEALKAERKRLHIIAHKLRQRRKATKNSSSREAIDTELDSIHDQIQELQRQIKELEGWT